MSNVVRLPGSLLTADEVLTAEIGTYNKVILLGVTHDGRVYCSVGGDVVNHEVVYLCEMLKMDVLHGGGMLPEAG